MADCPQLSGVPPTAPHPLRMTSVERRASASLASIFALRMLGLFLILPVFAVHAQGLPGGQDTVLVGLALGIYGLTQGLLQIPFGMASDRLGRKPVMMAGLLLFAAGSFLAAWAPSLPWVIAGRALQGAGAISAAVTAAIADSTRESQRTKAMAMVGASIGLTFALSLVLAPLLYRAIGMSGMFAMTGALALAAIAVVKWVVPELPTPAPADLVGAPPARSVVLDGDLLRLNFGIFVLHATQMAMFVVLPGWLVVDANVDLPQHWQIYLPVVLLSFAFMLPPLGWAERRGRMRLVFSLSVVGLLAVQVVLAFHPVGLWPLALALLGFFTVFNVLEATLPSLVSRLAPPQAKGLALGVYNTTQALGLFAGGALGGWLVRQTGPESVFVITGLACLAWAFVAPGMKRWPSRVRATAPAA